MKTYKYTIVYPTTRGAEETRNTNSLELAVKEYNKGRLIWDNENDCEFIPSL